MSTMCIKKSKSSNLNDKLFLNTIDDKNSIKLSLILSLHAKGYNQSEIAEHLKINQSTVSRYLKEIRKKSRKHVEDMCNQICFEYETIFNGFNQVIRSAWKMIEDENNDKITVREKHDLLDLLHSLYIKKLQLIVGGDPKTLGESAMNLINSVRGMKCEEKYGFKI